MPSEVTPIPILDLLKTVMSGGKTGAHAVLEVSNPVELIPAALGVVAVCAMLSGASMAWRQRLLQCVSSAFKVPVLLIGTLVICLPLLLVLNTMLATGLGASTLILWILLCQCVHMVIVASCTPIGAFFALNSSYHFLKLLHVGIYLVSGAYSALLLYGGLVAISSGTGVRALVILWLIAYGFVGMQMAWTLRPFLGVPGLGYSFLRPPGSKMDFYSAVWASLGELLTGQPRPGGERRRDSHQSRQEGS